MKNIFSYSLRDRGETIVGVVTANNIEEATIIVEKTYRLYADEDDIKELDFDDDGVCEIYYGC